MWKYSLLLLLFFTSCQRDHRLSDALEFAGDNRAELEKVLAHYKDSGQKYDAASFLIENMPMYYAYRGAVLDSAKSVLLSADTNGYILPERVSRWGHPNPQFLEKVYDAHVITADYLIDNIDRAFVAWKCRPWNKYLSFDDFCELILPYRVDNEPLDNWREAYEERYNFLLDSIYKGTDVMEAASMVGKYLKKEGFIYNWELSTPHLGASFLLDHHLGTCSDACDLAVYVMRSLGIPITIDFYPYCPESRKGHTWNSVRDTTGTFWGMWFTEKELKRGEVYSDGRKSGKILRKCFAAPRYKDASVDYFPDTLRVKVKDKNLEHLFLGVFHPNNSWVVVDGTTIHNGEAVFPHVEARVIYAPLKKKANGEFITVDYPFYFDGKEVHPYTPDRTRKEKVALLRKYPLLAWTANYLNGIYDGRFEFSNSDDFKKIDYYYQVPDTPRICYNEVIFPKELQCRYVRYIAPKEKNTDIGELLFYKEENRYIPVEVKGAKAENLTNVVGKMFDGDPLTYYCTWLPGSTLFMDFGKSVPMDRFVFIPRNDDNFIRIGDIYELYYHGGAEGWVSLGRKTAVLPELVFDNMPHGALFHLRCLTRGVEELPFQIENGEQVFISNLNSVK